MSIFNTLRNSVLLRFVHPKFNVYNGTYDGNLLKLATSASLLDSQIRYTSFFNKLSAEQLWKGVTSVSNAGKKRGRGKGSGKKIAKDLNRGQVIGVGKANIVWPGLTVPVLRGRELMQQQKLPEDPDRDAKLIKLRNEMGQFRRIKLSPIDRGWSGSRLPGRSVGPPEPIGEDTFEGFDTKALEVKSVFTMTGNMGRRRTISIFVVTGNQQGLAGFGLGKAVDGKAAIKTAKNRAGQRLMYIERYNNHTVHHDFFCQFGKTKIFVKKKPEGYGLVCHRAIKNICEVIGIKDLHAKIEGSTNLQHVVKAFFVGLLQQNTHSDLAENTGLNVVELKKERDYYPEVIASPRVTSPKRDQSQDFQEYIMGGKVILQRKKFPSFITKGIGWERHLLKTLRFRNQYNSQVNLIMEHGSLKGFLPEAEKEKKE